MQKVVQVFREVYCIVPILAELVSCVIGERLLEQIELLNYFLQNFIKWLIVLFA